MHRTDYTVSTRAISCERLAEIVEDHGYEVILIDEKPTLGCYVSFRKGNAVHGSVFLPYDEEGAVEVKLTKNLNRIREWEERVNLSFCCGAERDWCYITMSEPFGHITYHLVLRGRRWYDKMRTALAELSSDRKTGSIW